MESNRISQVLSAPVCHFVRSNEEEKAFFPDKKGWFYTIKLASGQRFVAHMDSMEKDEDTYTLRPLNHLLPDLKEIQWIVSPYIDGSGVTVKCAVSDGVSEQEKKLYEAALGAKPALVPITNTFELEISQEHALLRRLSDVHSLRLSAEKAKKTLLDSQKQLKSLEISDENKSVQRRSILNNGR